MTKGCVYVLGDDAVIASEKQEKRRFRGMAIQLVRPTGGSQWKRRVLYVYPGTQ